jgi:hypothetical protein
LAHPCFKNEANTRIAVHHPRVGNASADETDASSNGVTTLARVAFANAKVPPISSPWPFGARIRSALVISLALTASSGWPVIYGLVRMIFPLDQVYLFLRHNLEHEDLGHDAQLQGQVLTSLPVSNRRHVNRACPMCELSHERNVPRLIACLRKHFSLDSAAC